MVKDEDWTVVAHGPDCDDGTCPTVWERPDGWAKVRGLDPIDRAGAREIDVLIPPAEWAQIRARLRGVIAPPPDATLDDLFGLFVRTAEKLEVQQDYEGDDAEKARRAAWLQGAPRPVRSVRTNPYLRRVAVTTAVEGKRWLRVRTVDDPPTEGQRYGTPGLIESQAAGEGIVVIPRTALFGIGGEFTEVEDAWLFDAPVPAIPRDRLPDEWAEAFPDHGARTIDEAGTFAAVLHFFPGGRFRDMTVLREPGAVARLVAVRDAMLGVGPIPLNVYLAGSTAAAHQVGG